MSSRGKVRRAKAGGSRSVHSATAAWERQVRQSRSRVKPPPFASFWQRLGAWIIDSTALIGTGWTLARLLDALTLDRLNEPIIGFTTIWHTVMATLGVSLFLSTFVSWMYTAAFLSSRWQATPGKRLAGIVVTDLNGAPLSFARATARHFASFVSWYILVGNLIQPFTKKRQALHDLITGTLVVQKAK